MLKMKEDVVAFLKSNEDPVKLKSILRAMGLPNSDRQYMRSILKELVREGVVVKRGAHFWVPEGKQLSREIKREKTRQSKQMVGRISVTSAGHGFVIAEKGDDWIIPEVALGGAMSGDTVRVVQKGRENNGRSIGEVIAIESFGRTKLLGLLEWYGSRLNFRPFSDIAVDANLMRNMPTEAEDGSVAQFLRQENGSWVFDKILGHIIDPAVDEVIALAENDVVAEFPEAVLKEASEFDPHQPFELGNRRDFRDEWVFTVDGADARDFDDALHYKVRPDGLIELGIHIADVATFVKKGSELDAWARQKGNSTYLPHKALPMLPEVLSNHLCSLNPDVPRYTTSVLALLTPEGELKDFSLHKGLIQSRNRLTYSQVAAACIDRDPEVRDALGDLAPILDNCIQLARNMRQRRLNNGSLNMDMAEVRLVINQEGLIEDVRLSRQTDANRMIEAYMVLANECVAHFFLERGIDIPFRIHEQPSPEKLERLKTFLENAGVDVPIDLMDQPGTAINKLIQEVSARPNGQVLQTQMLKAMKMAVYSPENVGHFGLASKEYSHFTSPIRRYADLVAHRRLAQMLKHPETGPEFFDGAELGTICDHISTTERKSAKAEQTFVQMKILRLMLNELGSKFEAIVTEVKNFGLFAEIGEYRAPGLVHISELGDDYYEYNPETLSLIGKRSGKIYTIGSEIEVQVIRVDLIARKLDLGLVGAEKKSRRSGRSNRSGRFSRGGKGKGKRRDSQAPPEVRRRRGKR